MKEYLKSASEVLKELKTTENGISQKEAEERLKKNGQNKLAEAPREGMIKKFIKSYKEFIEN